ncbi:MAG: MopE-related protein [Polyangiales bacterium]
MLAVSASARFAAHTARVQRCRRLLQHVTLLSGWFAACSSEPITRCESVSRGQCTSGVSTGKAGATDAGAIADWAPEPTPSKSDAATPAVPPRDTAPRGGEPALPESADEDASVAQREDRPPERDGCVPTREVCDRVDNDCDDTIDEGCECRDGDRIACYDGPAETLDVGVCHAGQRVCEAGSFSACRNAVTPEAESCNGVDDDCDGKVDNGGGESDSAEHCGVCGLACALGSDCCEGRCTDVLGSDVNHCGGCGTVCTEGKLPGCCGGGCVDLLTDQYCGRCDNACGLLKLGGGFLCHCELLPTGPACVGNDLGEQLQVCI